MNWVVLLVLNSFWFILPAYFANSAPVLSNIAVLRKYNFQLDGGLKFKGYPVFGSHKTALGFLFGISAAIFIGFVQVSMQNFFNLSLFQMTIPLALVLGFGALFGDLTASFIKRRLNIKSGEKAPALLDQLNLVFGAFLFSILIVGFLWKFFLILLILTPIIHKVSNIIAFNLGLKKQPW